MCGFQRFVSIRTTTDQYIVLVGLFSGALPGRTGSVQMTMHVDRARGANLVPPELGGDDEA